jgi:hypothetical protein
MVAKWEFYSLASMLLSTHGDDAEAEAARRLHRAEELNDRGEVVVWVEVGKLLPGIREERQQRGE